MKKLLFLPLLLLMAMVYTGCGYKEGVVNGDRKGSVYFTGNVTDVTVSIDDGPTFAIEEGRNNLYTVKPGKRNIKVYYGRDVIVNRDVYIGDGISKEIAVGAH